MTDEVGATLPAGARVHDHIIEQWLRAVPDGHVYRVVHAQTGAVASLQEYLPAAWAFRDADGVLAQPGRGREFQVGLRRFLQRGRQLSELHHPALPRALDAWPSHGTACILTTPVTGRTLADVVQAAGGRIPLEQAWPWLCACCDLAEWLHQQGKIHGSWDPETIGVRDSQELVFAMPEVEGPAHPASAWMPLEQSALAPKGVQRGPWTDVFGIAALAAFMLTGQTPANARRRPTGLAVNLTPSSARSPALQETLPRAMMAAIRVSLLPNARQRPQDIAQLKSMMGLFATAPVLSDVVKPVLQLPLVAAPTLIKPRPPANDAQPMPKPVLAAARGKLALLQRVDSPKPGSERASVQSETPAPALIDADAKLPAVDTFAVEAVVQTPSPTLSKPLEVALPQPEPTLPGVDVSTPAGASQAAEGAVAANVLPLPEPTTSSVGPPQGYSAPAPTPPQPAARRRLSAPVLALALGAAVVAVAGLWTALSVPVVPHSPQMAGDPQAQDIERMLKAAAPAAGAVASAPATSAPARPQIAAAPAVSAAPTPAAPTAAPVATAAGTADSARIGGLVPPAARVAAAAQTGPLAAAASPAVKSAAADTRPTVQGTPARSKDMAKPRESKQAAAVAPGGSAERRVDAKSESTARRNQTRPEPPPTRLARTQEKNPEQAKTARAAVSAKPADAGSGQKLAQATPRAGPAERRGVSCSQVLLEQSLGARVSPAELRNCR